jgi:hypothetical protein
VDSSGSGYGPVAGSYVHDNEPSGAIKGSANINFSGMTVLYGVSRVKLEPLEAEIIVFPSEILGQDFVLMMKQYFYIFLCNDDNDGSNETQYVWVNESVT